MRNRPLVASVTIERVLRVLDTAAQCAEDIREMMAEKSKLPFD
jgi:hypothetical protein